MNEPQLALCPFCGSEAILHFENDRYWVECADFECNMLGAMFATKREAVTWWNRRPLQELYDAATATLDWIEEYYPADIFDGSSGDAGPVRIVAIRENLRQALEKVVT